MAKFEFWALLVARKSGIHWFQSGYPRTYKNRPPSLRNSIPIKITIDVPDAYFEEPQLSFKAVIPDREGPPTITADIVEGIQAAIESGLGIKVNISSEEVTRD